MQSKEEMQRSIEKMLELKRVASDVATHKENVQCETCVSKDELIRLGYDASFFQEMN